MRKVQWPCDQEVDYSAAFWQFPKAKTNYVGLWTSICWECLTCCCTTCLMSVGRLRHVLKMFGLPLYTCLMTVGMACVRNVLFATVHLSDDCWYGMCLDCSVCHCTPVWWLLVWHVFGLFCLPLYTCLMTVGMACVWTVLFATVHLSDDCWYGMCLDCSVCHCTPVWWLLVWHVFGLFCLPLYTCLMTVGMACVWTVLFATVHLSDDCWYGMCLDCSVCHCTPVWWLLVWHVFGLFCLPLYTCLMTVGMACVWNVLLCLSITVWRLLVDAAALPLWELLRVSPFFTYWVCTVLVWNVQIFLWRRRTLSEAAHL